MSFTHESFRMTIYFIRSGPDGPIKIGFTRRASPQSRVTDMQVGNPAELSLIGVIRDVTPDSEGYIHGMFERYWIRGEWFHPAKELIDFIDEVAEPVGEAPDCLGPLALRRADRVPDSNIRFAQWCDRDRRRRKEVYRKIHAQIKADRAHRVAVKRGELSEVIVPEPLEIPDDGPE